MRIAVLSDVHANLPALEAVLSDAGDVDAIWHLGDIVGYGPEPDAVVDRLRTGGATGVRGNHDKAACGGPEIEWFNPDARRAMEWTRQVISRETEEWLGGLPERLAVGGATLVHGSLREPLWEYVTSEAVARDNLAVLDTQVGFHGHTHVPVAFVEEPQDSSPRLQVLRPRHDDVLRLDGRRALVNPGSVGQPRDGDPRASYLLWEPEAQHLTWRRVAYDVGGVQRAMRDVGLPPALASRLAAGW